MNIGKFPEVKENNKSSEWKFSTKYGAGKVLKSQNLKDTKKILNLLAVSLHTNGGCEPKSNCYQEYDF